MHPTLAAILALAAIEITALLTGVDGIMFSLAVAAISGLGGYTVARLIKRFRPED